MVSVDNRTSLQVEDVELCKSCGGLCCQISPGRFSPDDLERFGGCTVEVIDKLLDEGVAAIRGALVCVMNSQMAPMLLLAAQGVDRPAIDLFRDNFRCVHLTSTGCAYSLDERPFECAAIVPDKAECKLPDTIHMEDLWVDQQDILWEIVNRRSGRHWLEEFKAQLYDPKRSDSHIRNFRDIVNTRGICATEYEIKFVIQVVRSIPG